MDHAKDPNLTSGQLVAPTDDSGEGRSSSATADASVSAPRHRDWGESAAILFCLVLFVCLRNRYTFGTPAVTMIIGLFIAAVFVLSLVSTIVQEHKWSRRAMAVAALILATVVALSLAKVIYLVIYQPAKIDGFRLIESSLMIWVSNTLDFAIIYRLIGEREFAFPRPAQSPSNQAMNFLDYVFLSFTTATAFSPTDTSPLSTRARMFMMVEATVSLATIAIAAARAINVLPQ
jgi:hypothetical protein